ncbi:MAG: hypothetical protein KGL39_28895 [Patescibacteria group bacterium]|nr:hypothetical protein [Patescibacteria group bacterium]
MPTKIPITAEFDESLEAFNRGQLDAKTRREMWQRVIDGMQAQWNRDPPQMEDEWITPVARETLQRAVALAKKFQERNMPPPDSVVADPNGGIVFRHRGLGVEEVLYVWEDGPAEYQLVHGNRLIERRIL